MSGTFRVAFEVAGAPRGKGRPRAAVRGGHAHIYTDAKTRSEEAVIRDMAQQVMDHRPPYDGPVLLTMTAFRPIPAAFSAKKRIQAETGELVPTTKPDADNYLKVCDALNGIVWRDDSQVVTAIIHKRYSERPRLQIEVVGRQT